MREKAEDNGDVFLILTGVVRRVELLTDIGLLQSTLQGLVTHIGMHAINEAQVVAAVNNPGLEGYIPIDASNITISTYTSTPRLVACLHSCRPFDHEKVIAYITARYECVKCTYRVVRESELEDGSDD